MDAEGKKRFYGVLRAAKLNLTLQSVFGMEKVLAYAEGARVHLQLFKYILATAWWETAGTMHPVKEAYWLSETWRAKHLRYYPWYGRGLIQTTWESNYRKMWEAIGRNDPMEPDAFLTWEVALPALFTGMLEGLYTGREIEDFIDTKDESDAADLEEMRQARRVVNGMDRAKEIARLGLVFERALKAGGYTPA